jgi:hypothetical protein
MSSGKGQLITIIGAGYFQPIADLLDRWPAQGKPTSNKVQSGYYENGYAASVALLLVAMFESYVSRLRYIQGVAIPTTTRGALDVVFTVYPLLRHKKALKDVYVLRDSLIHNHIWEIDYEWGVSPSMVLLSAAKHAASGDTKYLQRVNLNTHRTKALRLSVLPTRVDRTDVLKIFDTLWKTLLIFEATDRKQCYVSNERVRFRGKTKLFSELRDEIY